jgi:hypothetical protein
MYKADGDMVSIDLTDELLGQAKYEMFSAAQLLDVINRGIMKCYSEYQRAKVQSTGPYTTQFTSTLLDSEPTSDPVNIPGSAIGTSAAYIKLHINRVNSSTPSPPKNLKLYLSNGANTVMLLNNPNITSLFDLTDVTFEDAGFYSHAADYTLPGMRNRYPFEPMYKLYPTANLSDWTVSMYSDSPNWNVNIKFDLSIVPINADNKVPLYAPYFSIDNATNLLTLNYSPAWYNSAIKIGFSKTLRTLLDNFDYNRIEGVDYLQLPQQIAVRTFNPADNANTIQLKQLSSSLYLFNQINRISFTTNISVEAEKTEAVGGTNTVLTDFLPDPAGTPDYYIYTPQNTFRSYRLLSHAPLRRVSVTAWVDYIDGQREIAQIRRGECFNLKMQLVPIGTN